MPSTNTHTIILKSGESFVLPEGGEILFVSNADSVQSDCAEIPDTSYRCGFFQLVLDNDDNDGHSGDETNTKYTSLKVGNTTYAMNTKVIASGDHPGAVTTVVQLNTLVPDQYLFTFTSVSRDTLTKKQVINLHFNVANTMWNTTELTIDNGGTSYYVRPIDCE